MNTVDKMIADIIHREGGYVDHPNDNGGATNLGVSLRYAKGKPELDLDHDGDIDKYDIKIITPEVAAECYREDFFVEPGYDRLPEVLQPQMFDLAVNAGAKRASNLLQRAITNAGVTVHIDGDCGPETIRGCEAALNKVGEKVLNNLLVQERLNFYDRVIANDPRQKVFEKGWKSRAKSFKL